ncbi:trehalase, partial [Escherichia coli]|nr:trehalase [Escherichia coli]
HTLSPAKNGVNSSLHLFVFRCAIGAGRRNIGNTTTA